MKSELPQPKELQLNNSIAKHAAANAVRPEALLLIRGGLTIRKTCPRRSRGHVCSLHCELNFGERRLPGEACSASPFSIERAIFRSRFKPHSSSALHQPDWQRYFCSWNPEPRNIQAATPAGRNVFLPKKVQEYSFWRTWRSSTTLAGTVCSGRHSLWSGTAPLQKI
jgi:hypothetical protein